MHQARLSAPGRQPARATLTSAAPRDEIRPLWPTWIGQGICPGAEKANRGLAALAASPGVPGNLFAHENVSVDWLRKRVLAALEQWFRHARVQPAPALRLHGTLEALGFGYYRELANAPGAYLAGMYFANAPAAPELQHIRSDCRPSHLTMMDPRVGFNAMSLDGDPNFNESRTIAPEPGMLMLWPGYLRHCSRVHLSHEPWVRVALRVELERPGAPQ